MRIGILTGGGDVPGLNTVIHDITVSAEEQDISVIGFRRGWASFVYMDPSDPAINTTHTTQLTKDIVRNIHRSGGTMLHTSRTKPSHVRYNDLDRDLYKGPPFSGIKDFTEKVKTILKQLCIDCLISVGGDDTLSYSLHLHRQGIPVIGIPKTMDGDVAGTDYCIGFSSAISKASEEAEKLRTHMGSHERIGIIELFGRHSGFTGLYTARVVKPNRLLIPEVEFSLERITKMLYDDRKQNPSRYSWVIVSEGARIQGNEEIYQSSKTDAYNHKKLGGIGKVLSQYIQQETKCETISEAIRYPMRSGKPIAKDRDIAMEFANIAFDAALRGETGKMTAIKHGKSCLVPLEETAESPLQVNTEKLYNSELYQPRYRALSGTITRL